MCIALNLPVTFSDPGAITANMVGANFVHHYFVRGLRLAGVDVADENLAMTARTYGLGATSCACLFHTRDAKAALPVIQSDIEYLFAQAWAVIGFYDTQEMYWRSLHPRVPPFDLDVFINSILRLDTRAHTETIKAFLSRPRPNQ